LARALDPAINAARAAAAGVAVVTVPETRWAHPHINTLQLLPNVLAKQTARHAGAFEAWFVDGDGFVTEGASTNVWIVTRDRTLVTRQADDSILHGVTRAALIAVARALGLRLVERPFTPAEAKAAREAFFERHDARHAGRVARRSNHRGWTAWPGRARASQGVPGARPKVTKASITMVYRLICRRLPICGTVARAARHKKARMGIR
jgi:hypothetical protein